MLKEHLQQALKRLQYNCQPPEARRPLTLADYAEGYAALQAVEEALLRATESAAPQPPSAAPTTTPPPSAG